MNSRNMARGLAWFGIGLGLAELLAPRAVARAAGLRGHEGLLQAFGAREIASGAVILAARIRRPGCGRGWRVTSLMGCCCLPA